MMEAGMDAKWQLGATMPPSSLPPILLSVLQGTGTAAEMGLEERQVGVCTWG